ncbi:MAG: PIN domain-containing protein, partial [Phycisphaerae bacterium]
MLLNVLRLVFAAVIITIGLGFAETVREDVEPVLVFVIAVVLAGVVVTADWLIPRKSLGAIAGLFFGLSVGLLITYGIVLVLDVFTDVFPVWSAHNAQLLATLKLLIGAIMCYTCTSFVLQTRDDIRFVIPYVEFAKQMKGQHPLILDTSVIIDGRIADICDTRIVDQKLIVPRFVLHELQAVADSADKIKRNRGRRGLDVLNRLQELDKVEVEIIDGGLSQKEQTEPVDQKLLHLAKRMNGRVVTNDYNLNKVAQIRGIEIININDLANALKSVVIPGEQLRVKIIRL